MLCVEHIGATAEGEAARGHLNQPNFRAAELKLPVWHAYCLPDGRVCAASAAATEGRVMRQISTRAGRFLSVALLAAALAAGASPSTWAGGTLTVAMTAGGI